MVLLRLTAAVAVLMAAIGGPTALAGDTTCSGTSDDGPLLLAAESAGPGPLTLSPGTCRFGGNLVLHRRVRFAEGTSFEIARGARLEFQDEVSAPPAQRIFSGDGTVAMPGQRTPVYAEWWGAVANGNVSSNAAFQAAHDALVQGGTIRALSGTYLMSCTERDAVTFTNPKVNLYGQGWQTTRFQPEHDCNHAILSVNAPGGPGNFRDFQINGLHLSTPPAYRGIGFTGIKCLSCGVNDFSQIYMFGIGTGFDLIAGNSVQLEHLRLQQCAIVCIKTGGGRSDQYFGSGQITDVIALPGDDANGMIVDSGTDELDIRRFMEAGSANETPPGAAVGVLVRSSVAGHHRPEGIRFFEGNIDDNRQANVVLTSVWYFEYHNGALGGASRGPNLVVEQQGAVNDVDGVWFDATLIGGAAEDGAVLKSGCNFRFTNALVHANGWRAPDTHSGIRAGARACGLLEVRGSIMGLATRKDAGWGNVYNPQAYAVTLDAGAFSDFVTPEGRTYTGRVMVEGNMLAGNTRGAIRDASVPKGGRKLIANNMTE